MILDLNIAEAEELSVLPEGEHLLSIKRADVEDRKNKEGQMIHLVCESVNDKLTKDVHHYLLFPTAADDEKQKQQRLFGIKKFCDATQVSCTPLNTDDFTGRQFWAILTIDDNPEHGRSNKIKTLVSAK